MIMSFLRMLICASSILILMSMGSKVSEQEPPIATNMLNVEIFDLEWNPNGDLIAVATDEGVKILDQNLQEVTAFQGHTGIVTSVSWNPTGDKLASSGGDGDSTVIIWDYDEATDTFVSERSIPTETVKFTPTDLIYVSQAEWSPDGTKLAALVVVKTSARPDPSGCLIYWDTATWIKGMLEYCFGEVNETMAWSPDSQKVAAMSFIPGAGVHVADLANNQFAWFTEATNRAINSVNVDWSINNEILAFTSDVVFFEGDTGDYIRSVSPRIVASIATLSPDGDAIVFGSDELIVVDAYDYTPIKSFSPSTYISMLDWNSNTDLIVAANRNGHIEIFWVWLLCVLNSCGDTEQAFFRNDTWV